MQDFWAFILLSGPLKDDIYSFDIDTCLVDLRDLGVLTLKSNHIQSFLLEILPGRILRYHQSQKTTKETMKLAPDFYMY